jgi:hypothetical protein
MNDWLNDWLIRLNISPTHHNTVKFRRNFTLKTMKMVCVVFCASLLGTHICRESCLPQFSTQALLKDAKWQSIQISPRHPRETVSIKFPRVGNKNQSNVPHMPNLPPPPWINIDRCFTKSLVFPCSSNKVYRKGTTEQVYKFLSEHHPLETFFRACGVSLSLPYIIG